jgi:hypothetical protein
MAYSLFAEREQTARQAGDCGLIGRFERGHTEKLCAAGRRVMQAEPVYALLERIYREREREREREFLLCLLLRS